MNPVIRARAAALRKHCAKGLIPHELRVRKIDGARLCRNCGRHLKPGDNVDETTELSAQQEAERDRRLADERESLARFLCTSSAESLLDYVLAVLSSDPSPFTRNAVNLARDFRALAAGDDYNFNDWQDRGN